MSVSHVIPLLTPTGDFRFGVVKGELGKKCMSGQEDGCLFGLLMQAESVCVSACASVPDVCVCDACSR